MGGRGGGSHTDTPLPLPLVIRGGREEEREPHLGIHPTSCQVAKKRWRGGGRGQPRRGMSGSDSTVAVVAKKNLEKIHLRNEFILATTY